MKSRTFQSKHAEQGSMLIEVIVSVFVMAFGIMALVMAQMKSTNSVREAEMQSRVAQAVQNLSEGILVNPDERGVVQPMTAENTKSTYNLYLTANAVAVNAIAAGEEIVIPRCGRQNAAGENANTVNKQVLRDCHIQAFTNELRRSLPNTSNINYSINEDNDQVVINVEWREVDGDDVHDYTYSMVVGE